MKPSAVLLCIGLTLVGLSSAWAQQFVLTVTTTDDKTIEGIVDPKDAGFEAVTQDGTTVKLQLEKTNLNEKKEVSETITRTEKGFVIRADSYTAFFRSIWKEMPVRVGDQVVKVAGDQVKAVIVKWVKAT